MCNMIARDRDLRVIYLRAYNDRLVLPVDISTVMSTLIKSFQDLQNDISRRNETAAADSIKALASIADILVSKDGDLQTSY